jgi:GT2 family glycosyltransferase
MVETGITVVVTAYKRHDQTVDTLRRLAACAPPPEEVLVHVDGNQAECAAAIHQAFPDIRVILSETNLGPGGARNKLIAAARNEWVASFDDDSYPIDPDYFARVASLMARFPEALILNASVYHQGEEILPDEPKGAWTADFSGGACIYRRSAFMATSGYVPLPTAYGMEEVDLALRLHAMGGRILHSPWLRVFHDTDLKRHSNPAVTVGSLANTALLAFLRYPIHLWWIGAWQVFNRIRWLLSHGRRAGILVGLMSIPTHLWRYRSFRKPVSSAALRSYLKLRRHPVSVSFRPESPIKA